MKVILITGSVLVGIAFLAGCSERSPMTAPLAGAAALAPDGLIGDRSYTWSFTCQINHPRGPAPAISASWQWNQNGVEIAGTGLSASCFPVETVIGSGVRPANANGFTACVALACQSWTFDPSQPFSAQQKGTFTRTICELPNSCVKLKVSGTLDVAS